MYKMNQDLVGSATRESGQNAKVLPAPTERAHPFARCCGPLPSPLLSAAFAKAKLHAAPNRNPEKGGQ